MANPYDRRIVIQKRDEITEDWITVFTPHARINKGKTDDEYLSAGAIQGKRTLVFEVRYFKDLEDISHNTQLYRVLYQDVPYNIRDYDDFMLAHKSVKLLGVSY